MASRKSAKKAPAKKKPAPKTKKQAAPKAKAKAKAKPPAKAAKPTKKKAAAPAPKKKAAPAKHAKPAAKKAAVKEALKKKLPARADAGRTEAKAKGKAAAKQYGEVKATTTLLQTVEIPAPPVAVYRAYLDAKTHSEITGGAAEIDARVGGKMSAHDGYIRGRFTELTDGAKIVQSWRSSEWPDGYEDSRLELALQSNDGGTRLTMVHEAVPTSLAKGLEEGWIEHYWEPMRRWFAGGTPGAEDDDFEDTADYAEPADEDAVSGKRSSISDIDLDDDLGDHDDEEVIPVVAAPTRKPGKPMKIVDPDDDDDAGDDDLDMD